MKVLVTKAFAKALTSLPPDRQRGIQDRLRIFVSSQEANSLRFRPFQGLSGYFLINGKGGDRILLRQEDEDTFTAVDVGPHDTVLRRWNRRK
ncbi:hypothetical protein [Amorphus orientalis]|uniref:mRNA-degrading endonuclease RelE of RelBE toxin-antitoxin system n=1 Tax=Amorphus orientalis TaxID=649198 RepID=A0AAE3VQG7_9HYPH|nr:hypothetical protein [Amorphus orientalis]MDQ0316444.1 mRNA-degrading endonuclease RelE of RelBE toxin-antitoxin system [Amorphus orientalis]